MDNWIDFEAAESCEQIFDTVDINLLIDVFFYREFFSVPESLLDDCESVYESGRAADAAYRYGTLLLLASQDDEARKFLEEAREADVLPAYTFLAFYHALKGTHPSVPFEFHLRSAELGWPIGWYFVGAHTYFNFGNEYDHDFTVNALERAAEGHVAAAMALLGIIYRDEQALGVDDFKARDVWIRCAELGNSYCSYLLASRHNFARTASQAEDIDFMALWEAAASRGNMAAQINLNFYYQSGSANDDKERANYWFEKSKRNYRVYRLSWGQRFDIDNHREQLTEWANRMSPAERSWALLNAMNLFW